jgi:twitching motility protein PilU
MEREQASKFVNDLLRLMVTRNGSDLFLTADFPPAIKVDGKVTKVSPQPLTGAHTMALARAIMNDKQASDFERTKECNFAISPAGIGRFRCSAFLQQSHVGLVLRTIPQNIPTIDSLGLPRILKDVALTKRGLIIMVGATGSGKTTSQAAMLDWRNENTFGHIITVEDPVEFVHPHKNCIVTQREIGIDTDSWEMALKNALRQAPDCIMIGEIRDRETMSMAISYALSGHLVLATLHANNSSHTLGRILSFYTPEARPALLGDLAAALKAIVSQRLIRSTAGGRVPAVEVLLNSRFISELIENGDIQGVREAMDKSLAEGSQIFEQDIARLINLGLITQEEGLLGADSPTNLLWRLQNDMAPISRVQPTKVESDAPSFTEITLDVLPEAPPSAPRQRLPGMDLHRSKHG